MSSLKHKYTYELTSLGINTKVFEHMKHVDTKKGGVSWQIDNDDNHKFTKEQIAEKMLKKQKKLNNTVTKTYTSDLNGVYDFSLATYVSRGEPQLKD